MPVSVRPGHTTLSRIPFVASSRASGAGMSARTRCTVIEKDDARAAAKNLCRVYAAQIKANLGIDDGDKIAIGVRPINPYKHRIRCPQTSPWLKLIASTPGRQLLRFSDSLDPHRRAKPFGATHLQLFRHIGDGGKASREEAKFYGAFTRNPITPAFTEEDAGKLATYFGRWQSRRGETGPWSLPVSMHIAA